MTKKSITITVFVVFLIIVSTALGFRITKTSSINSSSSVQKGLPMSGSWSGKEPKRPPTPEGAKTLIRPETSLHFSEESPTVISKTRTELSRTSNSFYERITQVFQFAPVMNSETGKMALELRPGRDFATFKELGFESGDRITRVNGQDLVLEGSSLTVLLNEITSHPNQETVAEIERDGYSMTIVLSLSNL